MDRHTKRITAALGEIDAALKDAAAGAAQSARDIMRRFESANLIERVDAFVLGRSGFDLRKFLNCAMGQQLGHFIAKTIDFTSKANPPTPGGVLMMNGPAGTVEFRAEVYVLTREQFERALNDAYRAGR